jgi:succinate dehydrogenase hydrophobic anchor subunit
MRQVIDEFVLNVPSKVCEERAERITRNIYYIAYSITLVVFIFYVVNLATWVQDRKYFKHYGRATESVAFGICAISMLVGAYIINHTMRTYSSILSDEVGRKRLRCFFGILTVVCTGQFLAVALYYS